jgi:hypothetical protein
MALSNDFFGLEMVGYDPFHQQKVDKLSRLTQLDGLITGHAQNTTSSGSGGTSSSGSGGGSTGRASMPAAGAMGNPMLSDLANFFMTMGGPNALTGNQDDGRRPNPDGGNDGGAIPGVPPGRGGIPNPTGNCPPGQFWDSLNRVCKSCPPGEVWENGGCRGLKDGEEPPTGPGMPIPPGGLPPGGVGGSSSSSQGGSGGSGGSATVQNYGGSSIYTMENIPNDIKPLRLMLASLLAGKGLSGIPAYGGDLTVDRPGQMFGAGSAATQGRLTADEFGRMGGDTLSSLLGFDVGSRLSPLAGSALELANTGGLPDITNALSAIEARSRGMMEDESAQIRERFGSMGLGAGSDVSEAVARGMGRGIAGMNAEKSALAAQVYGDAATRRLQGIPTAQNLFMAPENFKAGVAGLIPGISQAAVNPYFQEAGILSGLASMDMSLQEGNISRPWQNFVTANSPAYLDAALGLATGYPAPTQKPVVSSGGSGAAGWLGGIGSVVGALLGSGGIAALSDENAKEDIVPYRGSILAGLREMKINTWKYKNQEDVHIGPMAQEMHRVFGVGDGKTIQLVDVMGILLGAAKEIADREVVDGPEAY